MSRAPKESKIKRVDISGDVLFTGSIIKAIDRFQTEDELLEFLENNIEQFGYNNVTAYDHITRTWREITKFGGYAQREKLELMCFNCAGYGINEDELSRQNFHKCKRSECPKHPEKCECEQCVSRKKGTYTLPNWNAFLQIIGYDRMKTERITKDRSLKNILKNNPILHPLAEANFPDRQGIEAVLRGEQKSYEVVRKIMILVLFYQFWVKKALENNDPSYSANYGDAGRCRDTIDKYLMDSGYPALYEGNPYDWIFAFAIEQDAPLAVFREFMDALYAEKEDELH